MIKNVRIDFFRVTQNGVPFRDLAGILRHLGAAADPTKRNVEFMADGDTYRLQSLDDQGRNLAGDMLRIRMQNIPVKASLLGSIDELDLDDDEGIGEESAFWFDSHLAVLAYQRNRTGVPASRFCDYVSQLAGLEASPDLEHVVLPDAYRKLRRMERHTRFELKCAHADNGDLFKGDGGAVGQAMTDMSALGAPLLTLTASCGRADRAMNRGVLHRAVEMMRGLIGSQHGEVVRKLEISGRTHDDELLVVDLVEDRMVETATIDVGRHRHAPYAVRARYLQEAYGRRAKELRTMFETGT